MTRSTDRILTTHVGSLIRPAYFLDLLQKQNDGETVDSNQMAEAERRAVEVVRKQAEIGIDIVSDGEFGKSISWSRYVLERLNGFVRREEVSVGQPMPTSVIGRDRREFAEFYAEYDATQLVPGMRGWAVTGPISYKGQKDVERDVKNFKAALTGLQVLEGFMPAVSPTSVAPERKDEHYKSKDESLAAIAEAMRVEYKAIVDAGFVLQVDDSYFASMYDMLPSLDDYRSWAGRQVEVINHALQDIPPERSRFHVCWGSWNGPHVSDVELKDMVDIMLRINVGGYSIEMANPRHEHEWRVWETVKLPKDKVLVPGVISHATNVVEHPELVADRIVRLAKLVGRESVVASTDCGFAQGPFLRRVHPSIQWAKLTSLVDGAAIATKKLWN